MSVSKWAYSPSKCDREYCIGECDKCSKAKEPDLFEELEQMISEINITNIADNIDHGTLWDWCGAWREETKEIIKEIRTYGCR